MLSIVVYFPELSRASDIIIINVIRRNDVTRYAAVEAEGTQLASGGQTRLFLASVKGAKC